MAVRNKPATPARNKPATPAAAPPPPGTVRVLNKGHVRRVTDRTGFSITVPEGESDQHPEIAQVLVKAYPDECSLVDASSASAGRQGSGETGSPAVGGGASTAATSTPPDTAGGGEGAPPELEQLPGETLDDFAARVEALKASRAAKKDDE